MAEHSTLTGASLHECKNADGATAGHVNKADGAGAANFGQLTYASVADGFPVQVVETSTSALVTGTGTIPFDNTIPTSSEGNEVLTLSITPKSSTNILVIEFAGFAANSTDGRICSALYKDSDAAAIAATANYAFNDFPVPIFLRYKVVAASTTARTYKIRVGSQSGTLSVNGVAGVRRFGGVAATSLMITEYKAS